MRKKTQAGVLFRVSTKDQDRGNQIPDVERFCTHREYEIAVRYEVSESAWNGGKGGGEYRAIIKKALDDAWQGKFSVLIVWSLDRLTRGGAEDALRLIRMFHERGCTLLSVKESWLNGTPEMADIMISFAAWMAQQESTRRSERIKAGIERRKAQDPDFKPGRQHGAKDHKPRKRSGYVARYERDHAS
jgi:DNA invertase Pin-like site-specific DNA recombinase